MEFSWYKKDGHEFVWKIQNFLLEGVAYPNKLLSPVFEVHICEQKTEWRLRMCIDQNSNCIDCFLDRLDDETPEEIVAYLMIFCVKTDGISVLCGYQNPAENLRKGNRICGFRGKWNLREMMEERTLYFPDNCFTIRCQIRPDSSVGLPYIEYNAVSLIELKNFSNQEIIQNAQALSSRKECFLASIGEVFASFALLGNSAFLTLSLDFKGLKIKSFRFDMQVTILDFGEIPLITKKLNSYHHTDEFGDLIYKKVQEFNDVTAKIASIDGILLLRSEFTVDTGNVISRITEIKSSMPPAFQVDDCWESISLIRDLQAFYADDKSKDIQLISGNVPLFAHKALLRARSPVFDTMLSCDMVERDCGVIHIEDVDAVTLDNLLLFIYTDIVKDLGGTMAMNLLYAAEKYQILPLKKKCAGYLKKNLSVGNAFLILRFADIFHEESLKRAAQRFICAHHHFIFSSDQWRQFVKDNSALAYEIFQTILERYSRI